LLFQPAGSLPGMPGQERFAHGTRSRYVAGCRCQACRGSNTAYYHARQRRAKELVVALVTETVPITKPWTAPDGTTRMRTFRRACPGVDKKPCPLGAYLRKDSTGVVCSRCRERLVWNGLVSARKSRAHLRKLSAAGVGRDSVSAACDISVTVLSEVLRGKKRFVRANTEMRILGVTEGALADSACVPAARTWQLLDELLARGFTKREIARRLGLKTLAIQFKRRSVLARTELAVEKLYRTAGDPPKRARGPVFCECVRPLEADGRCGRCERDCRPAGMTRALLLEQRDPNALTRAFGWDGGWGREQRTSRAGKAREAKELVRIARPARRPAAGRVV